MPDLTYFVAVPADGSFTEQMTTLATGSDVEDIARLSEHATREGMIDFSVYKFTSVSSGSETAPDGKDVYRYHEAQYKAVQT